MYINKLKNYIKKNLPIAVSLSKTYKSLEYIKNYFQTNYQKNALLSYITYPFKKSENNFNHTNYFEAMSHARIMNELGYNVDIINYTYLKNIDSSKYDLIVGFGNIFDRIFEGKLKAKTIYYGTGMHVCHQNHATLKRLKDVYTKKGIYLSKSVRYVEKTWTYQTYLVDAIITLGNEVAVESYRKYYDGPIFNIPAPFYKVLNAYEFLERRNIKKGFLWFGSSGLIHKGLDLVLEFFSSHPDLELHICGPIDNEPEFKEVYRKELYETPNIHTHGFVNITSKKFKEILENCSFVIFPSCSEGGSPSVITAIGNGALIPIITRETTISTGYEIWIEDFTAKAIENAVDKALQLSDNEILELRRKNLDYVLKNHTQEVYYDRLKKAYMEILDNEL